MEGREEAMLVFCHALFRTWLLFALLAAIFAYFTSRQTLFPSCVCFFAEFPEFLLHFILLRIFFSFISFLLQSDYIPCFFLLVFIDSCFEFIYIFFFLSFYLFAFFYYAHSLRIKAFHFPSSSFGSPCLKCHTAPS